ncbi:uncharacterized protein FOMMEDRAFT_159068, partial [Fomitiporia mediterranea MF3/22]|uniref:uncharacterized protein n=1 Tax=Fomitiporia mediterranea (strain MF3/22) TaxID=694068 RepID=UPI000440801C
MTSSNNSGALEMPATSTEGLEMASYGAFFSFPVLSTPAPLPTTPLPQRGSLEWDLEYMDYNMRWENRQEFDAWLKAEEDSKCIELRVARRKVSAAGDPRFRERITFVCSRN